jgi:hypothetical protein
MHCPFRTLRRASKSRIARRAWRVAAIGSDRSCDKAPVKIVIGITAA